LEGLVEDSTRYLFDIQLMKTEDLYQALDCSADDYESILPLTSIQRDLYLEMVLNPDNLYNSMGYSVELPKDVDITLLKRVLQTFDNSQTVL
jgi:hypothetical protein